MQTKEIVVAVVGAGKTGKYLIEQLAGLKFVRLAMIADINPDAPGMVYARLKNIPVTSDYLDIVRMGKEVDMIIDVTGKVEVRIGLRGHMLETENRHTVIVPEMVAILLMSMAKGELVQSVHELQGYA